MTETTTTAEARPPRSTLPLLVAILALVVAGCGLWVSFGNATKFTTLQEHAAVAPPLDPSIEQIKQTLSSLQQAVETIQAEQQRQATQIGEVQQKNSAQQGEQKLISDQLGALSGRVNSLESGRAESSAPAPQPAPDTQRARRTKR